MKSTTYFDMNRREFLRVAGVGAVALGAVPAKAWSGLSPNERVNVAGIGVGSRGGSDTEEIAAEGANIVALCDIDHKYAAGTFGKFPSAKKFKDYRVMLDTMGKDVDAVIIGTPDHLHAMIAMEVMRRGKHVYCEKPLAHSIHEVRTLMAEAKKSGVVTQLGNQGHSTNTIRRL